MNNPRSIKILHITDQLSKGGAGRALIGVAKYTAKTGHFQHECISVKPLFDGVISEDVAEGLKVHVAPSLEQIGTLIERADIVQWHWWQDFPLMRADLPRKPTIVWCAVSGEYPPNELTREVVDFADVMVITNPMTRDLPAIRSLPEEERQRKVCLIFESADFERILPVERIPHDTFNVGWIGTICPGKYNPRYVEMSRCIEIPNVRFLICGEGPTKEAAIRETIHRGVQDRFQFLGYQDDMRRMFALFDVYGFPLDERTFAGGELNLQEAMVAGLPIVILPYGGPKQMILHNYNGLIAYSEQEYKEYLEFLYYHPEERNRLGNNARDYALREYGAENAARKFQRLYQEMVQSFQQEESVRIEVKEESSGRVASLKRLALFHQGKGNIEKAVDHARRYLEAVPDDEEMRRMLTRLDEAEQRSAEKATTNETSRDPADIEKTIDTRVFSTYKATAVVSTYASQDVFEGCLLDLFDQTLYKRGELEIIVVDAASPEEEWTFIERYACDRKHIVAVRTKKRESLYAAWNRAVHLARGQYISNANADDRHRRDALEVLAKALDEHPEVAIAYGDVLKTHLPGESFERNTARDAFHWGEYTQEKLESYCCIGPQPMWRRSLHEEVGYFDERYVSAGDYDFWLRVSLKYPMLHVDQVLGLYLDNPESLEHKGLIGQYERIDVLCRHHLRKLPSLDDKPLVSVIIPTYNRPHLLKNALQSLVDQTYPNWEALVINDGGESLTLGQDGLPDDGRVRILNLPENRERSFCRNLGIRESCGKYVAFLDDDDVFYRHHLELAVRTLEASGEENDILYTNSNRAWARTENGDLRVQKLELAYRNAFDRDRLLVTNYIPILALVFHRRVFDGEEFDEEMNTLEDHDLLIRLSRKHDFQHLDLETNEFRVFSPFDIATLERHKESYLKLYERYSSLTEGKPELVWRQEEHLRSLDLRIFREEKKAPSCTIVIDASAGKEILVAAVQQISQMVEYPNVDLVLIVPQNDASCMAFLSSSALRKKTIPIAPDSNPAFALQSAAQRATSELLVFLDSGCIPATPTWLWELVEVQQRTGAGVVSGLIVEGRERVRVRDASITCSKAAGGIVGLYEGEPFYQPRLSRIREVDAIGPGLVLTSRADFLQVKGLDPAFSEFAGWLDLCAKMRLQMGREVFLNPFAIGIFVSSTYQPDDRFDPGEFQTLRDKWGDKFIRSEEEWAKADGLLEGLEMESVG